MLPPRSEIHTYSPGPNKSSRIPELKSIWRSWANTPITGSYAIVRRVRPDMLYRLQRHALPIKAHFRTSLVLAYEIPAPVLRPLLPAGLTLDTYGNFGFLAIALVETRNLRPSFVPARLGMSFFLSGYRIFTRYQTTAGRTLRGLRIVRSDTNRLSMQLFGNLFTHYHYERSKFRVQSTEQRYDIRPTLLRGWVWRWI
jgi:hypothetical protein